MADENGRRTIGGQAAFCKFGERGSDGENRRTSGSFQSEKLLVNCTHAWSQEMRYTDRPGNLNLNGARPGSVINQKGVKIKFQRITVNPKQMDGLPCIRGLRIPVATVVGMVAGGMADDEILKTHPDLEHEDIRVWSDAVVSCTATLCDCKAWSLTIYL